MSDADWAALARELTELNVWSRAFGHEMTVAEPDRVVMRTSGETELCRQSTGQWVGEALEVLASMAAGFLPTSPGEKPGTFFAPYGYAFSLCEVRDGRFTRMTAWTGRPQPKEEGT